MALSVQNTLKYLYLAYLSNPASERCLYRALAGSRASSIVEIGMGMGQRSLRLIDAARRFSGKATIRFTGIDLFEARPAVSPGMTLKRAHRILTATRARIRLVPGDPFTALARTANALMGTDFVVISADQERNSLAQAMFYLPRMIHSDSHVFIEEPAGGTTKTRFRRLLPIDIARIANIADQGTESARAA
jgi:hypothetical protein